MGVERILWLIQTDEKTCITEHAELFTNLRKV
jgi:hypothetical protein